MKLLSVFAVVSVLTLMITACGKTPPADLVLRGGKIATVNGNFSFAEAIVVDDGKFVFVGNNSGAAKYIGDSTQVIDLGGKLVVPGLIDAHGHMLSLGTSLENIDLVGTTSYEQIIQLVAAKVKTVKPGEWILGRGWDQNDWAVKEFPMHDALSKVSPNNPVWLTRIDGHAAIGNAKTLEIAGITAKTADPKGGKIYKKKDGKPTGVFVDLAMDLVSVKIPPLSIEQRRRALLNAANECLKAGLTGVHDAGVSLDDINAYKYLVDTDQLGLRVYAMLSDPGTDDLEKFLTDNKILSYGSDYLSARSLKLLADGALGSRGAALLKPYSDDPKNTGLFTLTPERLMKAAQACLKSGVQLCVHAIGDSANRLVLNTFEAALKENSVLDHRFRIEHAQIVALEDIPRFKQLGVIPSMQPTHATSDMPWAEQRVGPERIKGAYAWQKFIKSGCIIPCGSDFPVELNNPMLGFYAAITRQDKDGNPAGGWMPDERMTREDALRGFTIWAATAAFQENILGSIETGKIADMVVLSADILTIPEKDIITVTPVYTITGGKIRYKAQQ